MILINFAHPITAQQQEQIQALTGKLVTKVINVKCQFDHNCSFPKQAAALLDEVGLTPDQWQSLPILVNPPSLASAACAVLAELHGRMGYFPPILRLRPGETTPPQYEVAEIINLQAARDSARNKR